MKTMVAALRAAGDPMRMRILLLLTDREACVCELMEVFRMTQSKLSHHLIALRKAGLLQDEKRGKWNYYRVRRAQLPAGQRELLALVSRSLKNDPVRRRDRRALTACCRVPSTCC